MPSLEETINDLRARGELVGLSVNCSAISGKYLASFTMGSMFGQSLAEDADPVKALMLAMTSAKLKRKAPTRREELGAEAKATGVIPQPVVEVPEDVEDLM